jgi:hypothetical protein
LQVWKKNPAAVSAILPAAQRVGHPVKSLMVQGFSRRTGLGAIRCGSARFHDFSAISAGLLTGFSAASPEN